ncbi:MAG: glycosyltransferase family 2 protein [Actinomycetes bacterium]
MTHLDGFQSPDTEESTGTSIVIPNWNGLSWLDGVLSSIQRQDEQPLEIVVVDNGSTDGSVDYLQANWPEVTVLHWHENRGFAAAANDGIRHAAGDLIALINTDIVLEPDWLRRASQSLRLRPDAASVATKMLDMHDRTRIYDTGDFLRRDGACEQRGRFKPDTGAFNEPGEVWSACAGAAVYRRQAVLDAGGFDERFVTYMEDVELGLRLRLLGWKCLYEPCVALHAGGGSEAALSGGATQWVERNTILLIARHFPLRWLGPVIYRQISWKLNALRSGNLIPFVRGFFGGVRLIPSMLRSRSRDTSSSLVVPIEEAIPWRPWHGSSAGGHRASPV